MSFNFKKAKLDYDHQDKMLDNQRNDLKHKSPEYGNYEMNLQKNHKENKKQVIEKSLSKNHTEDKESVKTIEAKFVEKNKHDDRTHRTNTLPINELAEEAQRERLKNRKEPYLDKTHFQKYKKEDLELSKSNFAKLDGINREIDKLWMASSWNRLTTSEKNKIRNLIASRDKIIRS